MPGSQSFIESAIVAGSPERRLVLGQAQFVRPLRPGSTWSRMRIGIRFAMDSTPTMVGFPKMWIGLMGSANWNASENLTNGPLSFTSHFVGARTGLTVSTWTPTGSPSRYVVEFGPLFRVGNTNTSGTVFGSSYTISAEPNNYSSAFLLEIEKGSPNFTFRFSGSTGTTDVTESMLRGAMQQETFAGASSSLPGHVSSTQTLAVDEVANGFLENVCVSWSRTLALCHLSNVFAQGFV